MVDEGAQNVDTIGVGLTLDTSAFDANMEKAQASLAAFQTQRRSSLRAPDDLVVSPQFRVSKTAVRGLRTNINSHLREMAANNEAVSVPVRLGRSDFAGMRAEISQRIGSVPITVHLSNMTQTQQRAAASNITLPGQSSVRGGVSTQELTALLAQSQDVSPVIIKQRAKRAAAEMGVTALAKGGRVTHGRTVLVGEEGPEFFTPDRPGTIAPRIRGGGVRGYGGKYGAAKPATSQSYIEHLVGGPQYYGSKAHRDAAGESGYIYHGTKDINAIRGVTRIQQRDLAHPDWWRSDPAAAAAHEARQRALFESRYRRPGVAPNSHNQGSWWSPAEGAGYRYGSGSYGTRPRDHWDEFNSGGYGLVRQSWPPGPPRYQDILLRERVPRSRLQYWGEDERWHRFRRGRARQQGGSVRGDETLEQYLDRLDKYAPISQSERRRLDRPHDWVVDKQHGRLIDKIKRRMAGGQSKRDKQVNQYSILPTGEWYEASNVGGMTDAVLRTIEHYQDHSGPGGYVGVAPTPHGGNVVQLHAADGSIESWRLLAKKRMAQGGKAHRGGLPRGVKISFWGRSGEPGMHPDGYGVAGWSPAPDVFDWGRLPTGVTNFQQLDKPVFPPSGAGWPGGFYAVATDRQGNVIGTAPFATTQDPMSREVTIQPKLTWVAEEHRRRGIATAMYKRAERWSGARLIPDTVQTMEGQALWEGNAEALKAGRKKKPKGPVRRIQINLGGGETLNLNTGEMVDAGPIGIRADEFSDEVERNKWPVFGVVRRMSGGRSEALRHLLGTEAHVGDEGGSRRVEPEKQTYWFRVYSGRSFRDVEIPGHEANDFAERMHALGLRVEGSSDPDKRKRKPGFSGGGRMEAKRRRASFLGIARRNIDAQAASITGNEPWFQDAKDWYTIAHAQALGDLADFGLLGLGDIGVKAHAAASPGKAWPVERAIARSIFATGGQSYPKSGIPVNVPGHGIISTGGEAYGYENRRRTAEIIRLRSLVDAQGRSLLSGPKVEPFGGNLTGLDVEAKTLDARMSEISGVYELVRNKRTGELEKKYPAYGRSDWRRGVLEQAYGEMYEKYKKAWGLNNFSEFQAILWSSVGRGTDLGTDWKRTKSGITIPRHPGLIVPFHRMFGGRASRGRISDAYRMTLENEGGTFPGMRGGTIPTKGFAVGIPPAGGTAELADPSDILDFARKYRRVARMARAVGAPYVGTWLNEGQIHIDPAIVAATRREADMVARYKEQEAIFGLHRLEEIPTSTKRLRASKARLREIMATGRPPKGNVEDVLVRTLMGIRREDREAYRKAGPGATDLADLVADINEHGIQSPATVTYNPNVNRALLTDGNTRLAAAKRLGLKYMPTQVQAFFNKKGHYLARQVGDPAEGLEHGAFYPPSRIGLRSGGGEVWRRLLGREHWSGVNKIGRRAARAYRKRARGFEQAGIANEIPYWDENIETGGYWSEEEKRELAYVTADSPGSRAARLLRRAAETEAEGFGPTGRFHVDLEEKMGMLMPHEPMRSISGMLRQLSLQHDVSRQNLRFDRLDQMRHIGISDEDLDQIQNNFLSQLLGGKAKPVEIRSLYPDLAKALLRDYQTNEQWGRTASRWGNVDEMLETLPKDMGPLGRANPTRPYRLPGWGKRTFLEEGKPVIEGQEIWHESGPGYDPKGVDPAIQGYKKVTRNFNDPLEWNEVGYRTIHGLMKDRRNALGGYMAADRGSRPRRVNRDVVGPMLPVFHYGWLREGHPQTFSADPEVARELQQRSMRRFAMEHGGRETLNEILYQNDVEEFEEALRRFEKSGSYDHRLLAGPPQRKMAKPHALGGIIRADHGVKMHLGPMRADLRGRVTDTLESLLEQYPAVGRPLPDEPRLEPGLPTLSHVIVSSQPPYAAYSRPTFASPPGSRGYGGQRFRPGFIEFSERAFGANPGKRGGTRHKRGRAWWMPPIDYYGNLSRSESNEFFDKQGRLIKPHEPGDWDFVPGTRSAEGVTTHEFMHSVMQYIKNSAERSWAADTRSTTTKWHALNFGAEFDQLAHMLRASSITARIAGPMGYATSDRPSERWLRPVPTFKETPRHHRRLLTGEYPDEALAELATAVQMGTLGNIPRRLTDPMRRILEGAKGMAQGGRSDHGTYLVGELAPELFVPDRLRYIIPEDVMARIPKRGGGGGVKRAFLGALIPLLTGIVGGGGGMAQMAGAAINQFGGMAMDYAMGGDEGYASGGFMSGVPRRMRSGLRNLGSGVLEVGTRGSHLFDPPEDGWIVPHNEYARVFKNIPRAAGGTGPAPNPGPSRGPTGRKRYRPTQEYMEEQYERVQQAIEEAKVGRVNMLGMLAGRTPRSVGAGAAANVFGGRTEAFQAQSEAVLAEKRFLSHYRKYGPQIEQAANMQADLNRLNAKQRRHLQTLMPHLEKSQQLAVEMETAYKKAKLKPHQIARSALSTGIGYGAAGIVQQAIGRLMQASVPQIAKWVDSITGFTATNIKVTQQIGGAIRQNGGNLEKTMGQIALTSGLSGAAMTFLGQTLGAASFAKAGAQIRGEKSDLFRASANVGAPTGLIGGYGGVGGGGILAEMMGGGKGYAEQIGLDLKDFARKSRPTPAPEQVAAQNKISAVSPNQSLGGVSIADMTAAWSPWMSAQMKQQAAAVTPEMLNAAPQERTPKQQAAYDAMNAEIADLTASMERGAKAVGETAYGFDDIEIAAAKAGLTLDEAEKAIAGLGDEAKNMAESQKFFVDEQGRLVTTQKEYQKALQQGARGEAIGTPEAYAASQKLSLEAAFKTSQAQMEHALQISIPAKFGQQFAAQPFMRARAGISTLGGERGGGMLDRAQKIQDALERAGDAAIQAQVDWIRSLDTGDGVMIQNAASYDTLMGKVSKAGDRIVGLQTKIAEIQLGVAEKTYANNLRLANRAVSDALGLAGRARGQDNLGWVQRQQTMLGFGLQQKQINFQVAMAGFQAPGLTSEERAARQKMAQIEARIAQRQLDLSRQAFGIQAKRGVTDTTAAREILKTEWDAQKKIAAANVEIARVQARMAKNLDKANTIVTKAEGDFASVLQTAMGHVAAFGGTAAAAIRAIRKALRAEGPDYNPHQTVTSASGYYGMKASGYIGSFAKGATFTVGEAGTETVAILRNPRSHFVGGDSRPGASGPVTINFTLNVQGDVKDEATVAKITRAVEDMFNRKAARLGMRTFVSAQSG